MSEDIRSIEISDDRKVPLQRYRVAKEVEAVGVARTELLLLRPAACDAAKEVCRAFVQPHLLIELGANQNRFAVERDTAPKRVAAVGVVCFKLLSLYPIGSASLE